MRLGDRSFRGAAHQPSRDRGRRRPGRGVRTTAQRVLRHAPGRHPMIRPHGIGLYAPSGFALDPRAIDRAVTRLTAMWERVVVDPTCRTRLTRFSASDDERLAAIMRMARDPAVDLAIALRGGYGLTR